MENMEGKISGMIPNTINILRDNLHDRYDSGFPVLKELIQNANDAGASVLKIYKSDGISIASHPLLKKPALLVFNNGIVKDKDLEGIRSVAQGGKAGSTGVIGKFGLGMKSIFHFCDMFFYAALQNNNVGAFAVNPYIDLGTGKDIHHSSWNSFTDVDKAILTDEIKKIKTTDKYNNGLLLWIPLRDDSYDFKILKDIYTLSNIFGNTNVEQLKKNIALALVSLEISTPCIGKKRSLEKVEINIFEDSIELYYKADSNTINSNKAPYCEITKSSQIRNEEEQKLLSTLIAKDKFTKLSFINEKDEEKEIAPYTEDQEVGMAVAKFISGTQHSISVNWCSYLPLNGTDDTTYYSEKLDNEYHIILHANFAIDSGRRKIVNFSDCINKDNPIDIEHVVDDKSSQVELNKILIRCYILPHLLKFICENKNNKFFEVFYKSITELSSKLGYLCLDKGFAYKKDGKWTYQKTKSIEESALSLLGKTAENYSDSKNFSDLSFYEIAVRVCNYIQYYNSDINWLISVAESSLKNDDLIKVNEVVCRKQYPILLLPSELEKLQLEKFQLTSEKIPIAFLNQLIGELEDKASDIFESLCSNGGISKDISAAVFKDDWIKKFAKIFKVQYLDPRNSKYLAKGITYDEICKQSNNSLLFWRGGTVRDSVKNIESENIFQYQRMCPEITVYSITETTARNQLFLIETNDPNNIRKYTEQADANGKVTDTALEILDSGKITAILYSINKNLNSLSFTGTPFAKKLLYKASELSDGEKKQYSDVLRAILVGKPVDSHRSIFRINEANSDKKKALFYYELLSRIGMNKYAGALVNPELDDFPHSLMDALNIQDIDCVALEHELKNNAGSIEKNTTNEEKDKLTSSITDEDTFKRLCIQKTVNGEYINLDNSTYNVFLESADSSICFPDNYTVPADLKIVKINSAVPLQKKCIKELQYEDVINTILLDQGNELGSRNGIKLSNFVRDLLVKSNINSDAIVPNARERKWIPDNSYGFYALDEVIDCSEIDNCIPLCSGIVSAESIDKSYLACRNYFVNTKEAAVKTMLLHPDTTSPNKWPWFNLNDFTFFKNENIWSQFLPYISYSDDSSVKIVLKAYNNDKISEIFSTLKDIGEAAYITDKTYVSQKYADFLFKLCCSFEAGKKVDDGTMTFLEEAFAKVSRNDINTILHKEPANNSLGQMKLPSENGTWEDVSTLANFTISIPELKKNNAIHNRLSEFFPAKGKRSGTGNSSAGLTTCAFIDKLSVCNNKKLWGAFCYCICPQQDMLYLKNHAELIEHDNIADFKKLNLPAINSLSIKTYGTNNNCCESLTGKTISLSAACDIDTVFYNPPEFKQGNLSVEVFDNFSAFTATSVEDSVKQLLTEFGIQIPDEKFFDNLANPSQAPLNTAINMIFTNVFATLKVLKLDTQAGANNIIADEYRNYMESCGLKDYPRMETCCDKIKQYIKDNSGTIQQEIRGKVINYIRDAEYQERCILFELFQNADDAYTQKPYSLVPYFSITGTNDTLAIEHSGRPINEYKNGGHLEYKADLTNMLTIGWSDKANLPQNQTGKFGYGFKTVYLISDEPHITSGDYDFVIKAALYPEQEQQGQTNYTDTTTISLPLNDNGKLKCKEIVDSFSSAARFLVCFSKNIRNINITIGKEIPYTYSWPEPTPDNSVILSNFIVQESNGILLFKSIPEKINDKKCRYFSFAFKTERKTDCSFDGNNVKTERKTVCSFDGNNVKNEDKIPKIWCLAPLNDFKGLNFAINAQFKTNTGRQTLAINDPDNKHIADEISKLFVNAVFELNESKKAESEKFKSFVPSLINIILDADTKTEHFFGQLSSSAIEESLKCNLIPDGTKFLKKYTGQQILSISAKYFNDHIDQQYKTIKDMNDFVTACDGDDSKILVTTQLDADLLHGKVDSSSKPIKEAIQIKKVIQILDCLLNKNAGNIEKQKEIIKFFKGSPLFPFVQNYQEELSECRLRDSSGQVKMVNEIFEVSDDYGIYKDTLQELFTPARPAAVAKIRAAGQQVPQSTPNGNPLSIPSIQEVFERWKKCVNDNSWKTKVNDYYNSIIPSYLNISDLKTSSDLKGKQFSDDTMPVSWCILILIGMLQSVTAWGHSGTSRKLAVQWLYDKGFITKFCGDGNTKGENLQELYDLYLKEAVNDEDKLPYFEQLLRIYKIRKNFYDFYDSISKLPLKDDFDDISKFLVTATDEELSGSGIVLSANNKSLKLGISFIIRELLRSGFYSQEDAQKKLGKFAYLPSLKLRQIVTQEAQPQSMTTSEEIFNEVYGSISDVENSKTHFMECYDLPFIILGAN